MRITLHSTDRLTTVDGARCRVWHGETEDGVQCVAFVTRVVVRAGDNRVRLDRELLERQAPPVAEVHEIVDAILGASAAPIDARLLR